jgi:N-acetylmuramoyl-L-alanine amidase
MSSHTAPSPHLNKKLTRRTAIKAGVALLLSVAIPSLAHAANILAVRVWPSDDYTRVTLENDANLKATHFIVPDPLRLVVDVEGLELNPTLKALVAKIEADDPYIKKVRVGQNRPGVVRLVFDLKKGIAPQVFTLKPAGGYQHRLVFDLYPEASINLAERIELKNNDVSLVEPKKSHDIKNVANRVVEAKTTPQNAKGKRDRIITIVIDPGHGGEDPGAVGAGGNKEKHVVLQIAKKLKTTLEKDPNVRVVLTRDGDYFVPLTERVKKARQVKADLFVSVHADAWIEPTASGSSVFILSEKGASSAAAKWIANKENASDLVGGVNIGIFDPVLAGILLDMSTTAQIKDSMQLAREVLGALRGVGRLHKGSVEQAGFAVLKAPDIPSILIETAFLSNPDEERKLTDHAYQNQMATAVADGIKKYFSHSPTMVSRIS